MSAIIIAHFKAQEGKLEEMAEVFKASLGATRGFEGCIGLDVYVEASANTYTLIEEWASVAHRTGLPKRSIYQLALKMSNATPSD